MADASFVQLRSPLVGAIVMVIDAGASLVSATVVALIESMKLEYPVHAGHHGTVTSVAVAVGEPVEVGSILLDLDLHPAAAVAAAGPSAGAETATAIAAPDRLGELVERTRLLEDAARPEAVARRHGRGLRTARENLADLVD